MRLVAEDGELPEADLVQDLAGLLVLEVVDLLALQRRQRVQCAARELRADEERLVGGDQRVAPEDRHEPRQAGSRKGKLVPLDRRVQAQRREVDDGLLVDELEQIPVGLDLRGALAPLLHVVRLAPRAQDAARLARLEDQRLEGAPLAEGDLDPRLPDLPRRQRQLEDEVVALDRRVLGRVDPGRRVEVAVPVLEEQEVARRVVAGRQRSALLDLHVLDLEEVGEVAAAREPHRHRDLLVQVVVQEHHLVERLVDRAVALDREALGGHVRQRWRRQEEGSRVVVGVRRAEDDPAHVLDREHEPVQEPRVLVEEARDRAVVDVARRVGQHEGRALEDVHQVVCGAMAGVHGVRV